MNLVKSRSSFKSLSSSERFGSEGDIFVTVSSAGNIRG